MSNVTSKKCVTAFTILFSLLAVILSLIGYRSPVSASPESLRWTKVNIPAGSEAGNWVLADGSDVRHLAMGADGALYASVQGLTYTLYRSGDGGLSWAAIGSQPRGIAP